jgi:hypothetical protein
LSSPKQNGNCLKLEDHGREAAERTLLVAWGILRIHLGSTERMHTDGMIFLGDIHLYLTKL